MNELPFTSSHLKQNLPTKRPIRPTQQTRGSAPLLLPQLLQRIRALPINNHIRLESREIIHLAIELHRPPVPIDRQRAQDIDLRRPRHERIARLAAVVQHDFPRRPGFQAEAHVFRRRRRGVLLRPVVTVHFHRAPAPVRLRPVVRALRGQQDARFRVHARRGGRQAAPAALVRHEAAAEVGHPLEGLRDAVQHRFAWVVGPGGRDVGDVEGDEGLEPELHDEVCHGLWGWFGGGGWCRRLGDAALHVGRPWAAVFDEAAAAGAAGVVLAESGLPAGAGAGFGQAAFHVGGVVRTGTGDGEAYVDGELVRGLLIG